MTCDLCSENEATVHLTETVDHQTRELHLCEPCARRKGAQAVEQFGAHSGAEQYFTGGLAELLAGLSDLGAKLPGGAAVRAIRCPACGMTYPDFKKGGRLGCGECYAAFRRVLAPLLKRIHGSSEYLGRVPPPKRAGRSAGSPQELARLKERLKAAVAAELFEEAARLRDRIRSLQAKKRRT